MRVGGLADDRPEARFGTLTHGVDEPPHEAAAVSARTVSGSSLGWVMSWAPWAELVEPVAWRKGVKERVKVLASKHR